MRASSPSTPSTIASSPSRALSELFLMLVSVDRIAWACFRAETGRLGRIPHRCRRPPPALVLAGEPPAPRRAGRRAPGRARRAPRGRRRRSSCCPRTRSAARGRPGRRSSPATTRTAKSARARRHRRVELLPGLVLGELACPWPRRRSARAAGPSAAPSSTTCRPSSPPPSAALVADVMGAVAPRLGDPLDRGVDPLLEAAALAGARPASASATRCVGLARRSLQLDDLARQRLDPLAVLLALGLLARVRAPRSRAPSRP